MITNEDIDRFKERDETLKTLDAGDTIEPNGFFDTPKNMVDLQNRLMNYNGSERASAMMGAMLAWNLACAVVNNKPKGD